MNVAEIIAALTSISDADAGVAALPVRAYGCPLGFPDISAVKEISGDGVAQDFVLLDWVELA